MINRTIAAALITAALAGCGSDSNNTTTPQTASSDTQTPDADPCTDNGSAVFSGDGATITIATGNQYDDITITASGSTYTITTELCELVITGSKNLIDATGAASLGDLIFYSTSSDNTITIASGFSSYSVIDIGTGNQIIEQ